MKLVFSSAFLEALAAVADAAEDALEEASEEALQPANMVTVKAVAINAAIILFFMIVFLSDLCLLYMN